MRPSAVSEEQPAALVPRHAIRRNGDAGREVHDGTSVKRHLPDDTRRPERDPLAVVGHRRHLRALGARQRAGLLVVEAAARRAAARRLRRPTNTSACPSGVHASAVRDPPGVVQRRQATRIHLVGRPHVEARGETGPTGAAAGRRQPHEAGAEPQTPAARRAIAAATQARA